MSTADAPRRGRLRIPRLFAPGAPVSQSLLALVVATGIGLGTLAARESTVARMVVGLAGGLIFFLIATTGRKTALLLAVTWLVFLGLARRILIPFAGWSDQDPLLLVGPGCAFMLWLNGRREVPKRTDALTAMTTFFLVWSFGQIFNPLGGSLIDGALGAIFWIPPLLWFFSGRTFSLSIHRKIVNLLILLAIPVALHGLRQTYFGLFPFEYTWLGVSDFGAAIFYEGFKIRSFGPLVSPQEYGAFLAFVLTFLWGTILAGEPRRGLRIALLLFLSFALFMQGTRSIFGLFLVMIAVTTIIWSRNVGLKLTMIGCVMVLAVVAATIEPPEVTGTGGGAVVVRHQLTGLLRPEASTLPVHQRLIARGFATAWEKPFGVGTSPTSIVQFKKGARSTLSTENDLSTVFVALGIPAGIAYTMFMVLLFSAAGRRFRLHRSAYSLATIGMLVAAFGQIWSGGMYAVSSFIWFTIGGLARPWEEEAAEAGREGEEAVEEEFVAAA